MLRHIALAATLVLPLAACKKKGDGGQDQTDDPDSGATGASGEGGPVEPDVPQDPDPPQLAQARVSYLMGNYAEIIDALTPVHDDLVGRKQYRAGGLSGAWLALAHARDVVDNGAAPARHAVAMAERTRDPEVACAGNMAMGAVQLGLEDFDGAVSSLEQAVAASGAPAADNALARILLGEALIGRAYGPGGGTTLQHPGDLDAARKAYQAALTAAAGAAESDMLLGRIHEGLAALGKYQGKPDEICTNARIAAQKYAAAGVSDYLREGPDLLASDAKCGN